MRILWLSWKDRQHPQAGGAEIISSELIRRLVKDGHKLILLTASYPGAKHKEIVNGCQVIRVGNQWTVYWQVFQYYRKHLRAWADLVIDEVNTVPFFARFYIKTPTLLFVHQLCRQIWFYQIIFPVSLIGYLLEPIYLWMLRKSQVVTISDSTKKDLIRFGFSPSKIHIVSEGIELTPLSKLDLSKKYNRPTLLSLGAIRPMKRTKHQLAAFYYAKKQIPELQLKIAGDSEGWYGRRLLRAIKANPYQSDIEYLGKVSFEKKIELMRKCHVLMVTSVKEGWGLVITEANSQGTPAVVYNVDGLRDSVIHNQTGIICGRNSPRVLAVKIEELLTNKASYQKIRENAWLWSKQINFVNSYNSLRHLLLKGD